MSDSTWRLTALDFAAECAVLGHDRLPYPFRPARQDGPAGESIAQRRDAAQRAQQRCDQHLKSALRTLLAPEMRIEVYGIAEPATTIRIRIHAGVSSRAAAIAAQYPGVTRDSGGDVVIAAVRPQRLSRAVVDWLPKAPAGTGQWQASAATPGWLSSPLELSAREQTTRFFDRPRSSVGEVLVSRGAAIDWRPDERWGVKWIDFVGDGRYRLRDGRATPLGDSEFVEAIERLLTPR